LYTAFFPAALDRGWIPKGDLNDANIFNACHREDNNEFKCLLKRGQIDSNIRGAMEYVLTQEKKMKDPDSLALLNLTGSDLEEAGQAVISDYFDKYHPTCDFGGIAMLIERNKTITEGGGDSFDVDSYFTITNAGPPVR
jgi:hypothetical protein